MFALFLILGFPNKYLNTNEARDFLTEKYPYSLEFNTHQHSLLRVLSSFFHDIHYPQDYGRAICINSTSSALISECCFLFR
jgi:hypothetical protein